MPHDIDAIVVGAGVVGLACARAIARAGHEVMILEQHSAFGTETSSRNSEVIHAGIYYPHGSLKGRLCVAGKNLLYQFCTEYGVRHRQCGKLIVATTEQQEEALHVLQQHAFDHDVTDLRLLSSAEATALEPELHCTAALLSPSTGIIDSHEFMLALLGDAERHGAMLVLKTPVDKIVADASGFTVHTGGSSPSKIRARRLINAAGLSAPRVASLVEGLDPIHLPRFFIAKGNYFSLAGKAPFTRLVYPVPEPGGLGVHFTLDLAGQGRFGPDVEWIDRIDYSVDSRRSENFYSAIGRYWPHLKSDALLPAYCGLRPKLVGPGEKDADFLIQDASIHHIDGLINLYGIESPGLTAALALAEVCVSRLN